MAIKRYSDPSTEREVFVCPVDCCQSFTRDASVLRKHFQDWHTGNSEGYNGYRRNLDGEGIGHDFPSAVGRTRLATRVDRKVIRRSIDRARRDMRQAGIPRQRVAEMLYLAGQRDPNGDDFDPWED